MYDLQPQFAQLFAQLPWEPLAVALAIAYLVLAVRQSILCWYCAFASTAIYTVLFWDAALLMESALNVYYMAMAVYGWYAWRYGGANHHGTTIHRLLPRTHVLMLGAIASATLLSGSLLQQHTTAALPYLDSFTTWASVLTTWLVARKVLENWLYWIVIDSVSIYLYLQRDLNLTALLFAGYVVLAVVGWLTWRRQWVGQSHAERAPA